jgi:hypothetical protein
MLEIRVESRTDLPRTAASLRLMKGRVPFAYCFW